MEHRTIEQLANTDSSTLIVYIEKFQAFEPDVIIISFLELGRRGIEIPTRVEMKLKDFSIKNDNKNIEVLISELLSSKGFNNYLEWYNTKIKSIEQYRIEKDNQNRELKKENFSLINHVNIQEAGHDLIKISNLYIIAFFIFIISYFIFNLIKSEETLKLFSILIAITQLSIFIYGVFLLNRSGKMLANSVNQ